MYAYVGNLFPNSEIVCAERNKRPDRMATKIFINIHRTYFLAIWFAPSHRLAIHLKILVTRKIKLFVILCLHNSFVLVIISLILFHYVSLFKKKNNISLKQTLVTVILKLFHHSNSPESKTSKKSKKYSNLYKILSFLSRHVFWYDVAIVQYHLLKRIETIDFKNQNKIPVSL